MPGFRELAHEIVNGHPLGMLTCGETKHSHLCDLVETTMIEAAQDGRRIGLGEARVLVEAATFGQENDKVIETLDLVKQAIDLRIGPVTNEKGRHNGRDLAPEISRNEPT